MVRHCISPGEDRVHNIYKYTDQIYKIIQFYSDHVRLGPGAREEQTHHDEKLDSSISRTKRVILEKALCNEWDWFCTLTISPDKHDRGDLRGWWKRFSQWMRDLRKRGIPIRYLIVPEKHADGTWHAHGLLSGIPADELVSFRKMDADGFVMPSGKRLPSDLIVNDYYNWPAYQEVFGFCSLGTIDNHVACAFYMCKYITKDQSRMVTDVGLHSYYVSQGLNGAVKHIDFYGRDPSVDALLVNKYDFCATGMTHVKHGLDWTFALDLTNHEPLFQQETAVDTYEAFEQMVLNCFDL